MTPFARQPGGSELFRIIEDRSGGSPHVLVVDDDAPIVEILCLLLEDEGYRASGETNGQSALRSIYLDPPDAIITDVMMPGMSGMELARRATSIDPDTVVLMMSAVPAPDCRAAYPTIQKPFDFMDVLELVDHELGSP